MRNPDDFLTATESIERLLKQPWQPFGGMPNELAQEYENATGAVRNRQVRVALSIYLLLNLICVCLDALPAKNVFQLGLILRLSAVPLAIAGILLVCESSPVWLHSVGVCLAVLPSLLGVILIGQSAGEPWADRYFMAAGVSVFTLNTLAQFRTANACMLGLFAIPISMVLMLGGFRMLPVNTGPDLPVFLSGLILVSIGLRHRMEGDNQKAFLLSSLNVIRVQQLAEANASLTRISQIDPLTGLFNRRYFDAGLARSWEAASISGGWIGLLMADVDHFKKFNDTAGHQAGDRCLEAVAAAIQTSVRSGLDTVARYGGEEFIAILPNIEPSELLVLAERVREAVAELKIVRPDEAEPLTISVGVASIRPNGDTGKAEWLLRAADDALYRAKSLGRNCVASATGMVPGSTFDLCAH